MTVTDVLGRDPSAPFDDRWGSGAPEGPPDGPGDTAWARRFAWLGQPSPQQVVTLLVVLAACAFTFKELQPSKLFSTSTPAGGDMGAHVWQPAYLRHHLLTHLRLTGWAPSWYAGFPALVFYFPLPMLAIVVLSLILPFTVAFKLVSVSGLLLLPVAAWAFGRLSRMPFPGPACLAAATLPFLFSREFTIYGGNIASTLAGEFSFTISLCAALVFLGLVARGLDTGKYRAWAAIVLAVAAMCHVLPTFFAIVGAIVLTLMRRGWERWRWTAPALVVSGLVVAFWALPFVIRLPYATDMGYEKITQYAANLFPSHLIWLPCLAGFGAFLSFVRRNRVGVFLTIMAALSALIFRFAPQARLWNARVLPFWFLCLYLLAGVFLAEGGRLVAEAFHLDDPSKVEAWMLLPIPLVAVLAALVWVAVPLRNLPLGHVDARTGQYHWLGITSSDKSFIPDWVKWNYSGYEGSDKARKSEYFALVTTMANLGRTNGCGRAMWEYEPELNQMGTPDALMLLPYWTHECIGSMEGLYYESSATTPYHFINAAELSLHPSDPVRGLSYPSTPDVATGIAHLRLLGVKYYMALTPETQAQADADSELRLVATSGPWPVTYTSGSSSNVVQRTWKIYQVAGSDIVSPLVNRPVVMKGVQKGGKPWLRAAMSWYLDPSRRDVLYAASGPSSWTRVAPTEPDPPRTALAPVQVSDIKSGDDFVDFDVDTVGVPVLVKVSYFPNWQASGAQGPWRVAPDLMVVIPTSHHVRLHYGYTPVDYLGFLFTLLGVAGVVWLFLAKPVALRAGAAAPPGAAGTGEPPTPWGGAPSWSLPPVAGPGGGSAWADDVIRPPDDGAPADDPYGRLEAELSGAYRRAGPDPARWEGEDIDTWLGFPAGLDLAHYRVTSYVPRARGDGAGGDTDPTPVAGTPNGRAAAGGGGAPEDRGPPGGTAGAAEVPGGGAPAERPEPRPAPGPGAAPGPGHAGETASAG
jgi:hypothetical protein